MCKMIIAQWCWASTEWNSRNLTIVKHCGENPKESIYRRSFEFQTTIIDYASKSERAKNAEKCYLIDALYNVRRIIELKCHFNTRHKNIELNTDFMLLEWKRDRERECMCVCVCRFLFSPEIPTWWCNLNQC